MSATRARFSWGVGSLAAILRAIESMGTAGSASVPLQRPAHHRTTGILSKSLIFQNPWDTWKDPSVWDALRWLSSRSKEQSWGHLKAVPKPTDEDFAAAFPPCPIDWAAVASPPSDAIQAVWAGHSTVLVQMQGLAWLTDPVFSKRASPVQWAGPRRVTPPAFAADAVGLPHLDFVLISHNHYDHLDLASVHALHRRYGPGLRWYVPLGLRPWFVREGIHNVEELDWWEEREHAAPGGGAVRVVLTPAQHATHRGLTGPNSGRRETLWGGWAVLGSKLRFWFAGDTGYCSVFKEIGEHLGPFDLAAIPTAAYEPRWFLKPQHVDPKEAVQIHQDVCSRRSLAIHWGTFPLTDEPMDEPPGVLREELEGAKLAPEEFVSLRHGASIVTAGGVDAGKPAVFTG